MMNVRLLPIALAFGCGSSDSFPKARFANAPPVEIVNDRRNVPVPPRRLPSLETSYSYHSLFERQISRALSVPAPQRALGVNAVDDVPDSTWFTHRAGLTPAQMRTGPVTLDTPERYLPWTIESTKFGGASIGFIIRDSRGERYLLKFDDPMWPEVETGTDVVVDRLLWALGYNVPEDQIVFLRPDQLVLGPGAYLQDKFGHGHGKLDRVGVAERLAHVAREPDGRIRALASRWLDGKQLGGHPTRGVRADDPNDKIAHERRRDLRGMYPAYAWLDVVDVWPGNFLDLWIQDTSEPDLHYVKHYSLDFGLSLGAMAMKYSDLRRGYTYRFDWPKVFGSLASFGAVQHRWERRPRIDGLRGVATTFTSADFQPGDWHNDLPYLPFETMDRFDGFWGAKLVGRLTREQIHAAVEAARFSDPRAVEYMTNALIARQRKTLAYWYDRVNPLDHFTTTGDGQLCFEDRAITDRLLVRTAQTEYVITPYDSRGARVGASAGYLGANAGRTCVPLGIATTSPDGYTVLEITTMRPRFRGTTFVHVARGPDGAARVIGLWRV
jgi:hypothetical protein